MLSRTKIAVGCLAAALCLTSLSGTAVADPPFVPDANDVVGVGSETSQYVIDTAAKAQSTSNPSVRVASFNASNPITGAFGDPITIRGATVIAHPSSSYDGTTALLGNPAVDYVRSAAPVPAAPNSLHYIPVLTDGFSYMVDKSAGSDIRNLSAAELVAIYRCTDPRGYQPKLADAASDNTRFFLAGLGLLPHEIGACVQYTSPAENDPAPVVGNPLALMPFSTARYAVNPPNPASRPSTVVDIAAVAVTTGVFCVDRTVHNVVRKADYDAAGSRLPAIFAKDVPGTGVGGFFCDRFANSALSRLR